METTTTKHYGTERRFAESRSSYIEELYQRIQPRLIEAGMAVMIYHRRKMLLEIHLGMAEKLQTNFLRNIAPSEFEGFQSDSSPDGNPIFEHIFTTVGYRPTQMRSFPFEVINHSSGVIAIFAKNDLSPLLELVGENSKELALRMQNATLLDALKRRELELELLQETGEILSVTFRRDEVFKSVVAALEKLISFNALGIFILEKGRETIEEIFSIGYDQSCGVDLLESKAGKGLVGWAAKTGEPVIVPNVQEDPRYVLARKESKSELVVPLISGGEVIGAFNLESDRIDAYSPADLEMVTAFANQAALTISRARLFKATMEKHKIEDQLEVARDIQKSFLPSKPPTYKGFDFDAINISSEQVGGDYFDFIPIVDHQLGVSIADVSGKGLPASLIMASYRASLIAEIRNNYAIRTIMRKVNNLICESVERGSFVTAVYGVLDTKNRIFTFCNAGHNPPFILRGSGEVEFLSDGGWTLGIEPNREYEERPVQISPGDILALYTDGVTEAENDKSELFGTERLVELVKSNRALPMQEIRRRIVGAITSFRSPEKQPDDLTLVLIKAE